MSRTSRYDRMADIAHLLDQHPEGLTHQQIADRLGLAKTPYTRNLILELVNDGTLIYHWAWSEGRQRVMVFRMSYFRPTEDELAEAGIEKEQGNV